ncbi:choline dehydrogenase [Pseudozyma hubeiensis SY62]|uniref:Choline dehydrogenase n=1 Tax=Pseudozyma hubeiensis (strain SY62) TaxID=1305764 RepID=R9P646_PSEHS|nr:choline dehydrogenase [Pseudozyma hubeiensis SY62]GAC96811.1 choline dehydrogenase [Pseudozyma hubeiensis SY62]
MTRSLIRLAVVAGLFASFGAVTAHPVEEPLERRQTIDTYDYIVVGGGTSGMALAGRLSENQGVTVAVLEAGTDYRLNPANLVDTPGMDTFGVGADPTDSITNGLYDWFFVTEGEPGYDNRKVHYARGKCIGGSSARNFMLYHRPPRNAQQTWVDLTGDSQWSFDRVLPYYQKSLTAFGPRHEFRKDNPPAQYNPAAFPGTGPVSVGFPNYAQPFSGPLLNSLNEVGVPTSTDMSSGNILGAQYSTITIEASNGKRATSRSFYQQALDDKRTNLNVIFEALAKKVVFDTTASRPKAVAVEYTLPLGIKKTIKARKEIIISAGAFQSPQLLMVSGIGPADQLKAQNIPVLVQNENVGQHMQDHVFFGPTYSVNVDTPTKEANDPVFLAASLAAFQINQGIFTNNVADLIGFEKWNSTFLDSIQASQVKSNPSDWPEIEFLSGPGFIGDFSNLVTNNIVQGLTLQQFASLLVAIVAPLSEGSVTLKSADTSDLPAIRPNWLSSPVDQKVAIAAFKRARQVFAANAMKSTRTKATIEDFPGFDVATDDQILASIRKNLMTVWHAASTCRMAKSPQTGVLDSNFRVFGVDALRVVDASSFPRLLPGHPQAVCYMIAERAADLIAAANK